MNLRLIPGTHALALCTSATVAHASTIGFDPSPDPFLDHPGAICSGTVTAGASCFSYEFGFALPDFDPAVHDLLSANLSLNFYDDNDTRLESVDVYLDDVLASGGIGVRTLSTPASPFTTDPFNVLSQLQADGLLEVLLQVGGENRGNSDFYFQSATLVAMWQQRSSENAVPTAPAPEPVELALFGIALSAFAFKLRRRKS